MYLARQFTITPSGTFNTLGVVVISQRLPGVYARQIYTCLVASSFLSQSVTLPNLLECKGVHCCYGSETHRQRYIINMISGRFGTLSLSLDSTTDFISSNISDWTFLSLRPLHIRWPSEEVEARDFAAKIASALQLFDFELLHVSRP